MPSGTKYHFDLYVPAKDVTVEEVKRQIERALSKVFFLYDLVYAEESEAGMNYMSFSSSGRSARSGSGEQVRTDKSME